MASNMREVMVTYGSGCIIFKYDPADDQINTLDAILRELVVPSLLAMEFNDEVIYKFIDPPQ